MMKTRKIVLCALLALFYLTTMSCTFDNSVPEDGINQSTFLIPVFNQLQTEKSRALVPPDNHNSGMDLYGMTMLPQLKYFSQGTTTNLSSETFPIQIFGETVYGKLESTPGGNQYTISYNLGDDDGYIEVTIDNTGAFSYKQYLLLDVGGGAGIMYHVNEIEDGQISLTGDRIGEYTAKGQLYYGSLIEDDAGTSISSNGIGQATTYIRGTESLVYGIVDPYLVIITPEDLFITNKSIINVNASDLRAKLDAIRAFDYKRTIEMTYPVNDIYYFLKEDKYDGYFSYIDVITDPSDPSAIPRIDTREKVNFETYTGYSFGDLGYPACENIYQFLGNSLGLDYVLIGEGNAENWSHPIGDCTYAQFTVESSGIYMVPPGFNLLNSDKSALTNPLANGGALLELQAGTTYFIGYPSEYSLEAMKEYSYRFKLD